MTAAPSLARQRGMTLIELMLATLVALFMSAGLLFVFSGLQRAQRVQSDMARLQDTQRIAMTQLAYSIEVAGYFIDPQSNTSSSALPANTVTWSDGSQSTFAAAQFITGNGDANGNGSDTSDSVALRLQTRPGDGITNCAGGVNTGSAPEVFTYALSVNSQHQLVCSIGSNPPVPLVDGIGSMRVLYGTGLSDPNQVNAYLPATAITAQGVWNNVRSVKVRLQFLNDAVNPPQLLPNPVLQVISLHNKT